jgi:ATP-dependent Clp protease ATP-binding subunit ClpC
MNNQLIIDTSSTRAQKARLGKRIGKKGEKLLRIIAILFAIFAIGAAFVYGLSIGSFVLAFAILPWIIAIWHNRDLSILPPTAQNYTTLLSVDALGRLAPSTALSPQTLWQQLAYHWHGIFISNRLLLPIDSIAQMLSSSAEETPVVLDYAKNLAAENKNGIEPGHILIALLLTNQSIVDMCTRLKIKTADILAVLSWLQRSSQSMQAEKPKYGSIGRDWSSGFTPKLDMFGENISSAIQNHGAHFGSLTESASVIAIETAFAQGASAVAIVGDSGSGKTSHAYAFAQRLLAQERKGKIDYHQLIGLNPSTIISHVREAGELEYLVMNLLGEAAHSGNTILFFDNAEMFMQDGHGSFDATRLLLPVIQNRAVKFIFAMSPQALQQLKANNPSFASALTPIMLQEPPEEKVKEILEDTALGLEYRNKTMITYSAIQEAYQLSGRYVQELSYPGKAIKLLEQAIGYPDNGVITNHSVQQAIEAMQGVKLTQATAVEADQLLNLEAAIHQRMINQSRAVEVVSNALRRARAGVANTNRPIGSFLFLGPTGVGKTELAKAIAAIYFNAESAMIRLDMSEYQQESDVSRILSDGTAAASSLIMAVRQQPFSVVLLDEVEKAHPNILNLLLQLLDEGQLTDSNGRSVSFRDCIIIATSNAGANTIREKVEAGQALEDFEASFTDELMSSGQFKPELLNRFDEIVLFRPLNQEELVQIVMLMIQGVNATLSAQNIQVQLSEQAIKKIVEAGYDPKLGARPMRRMVQRTIEDTVAKRILQQQANPGDTVFLDEQDIEISR